MNTKELMKLADDAYSATEHGKAIELYLQVLKISPKNKHVQTQLAKIESSLLILANNAYDGAEHSKAIELYLQVLKISPKNEPAQTQLAKIESSLLTFANSAYDAAEYDKAIDLYLQVTKVSPKNELAKTQLAKIESSLLTLANNAYAGAEYGKALELYLQVLKISPKNELAQTQLTKIESSLLILANNAYDVAEYDKAIELYLHTLKISPKNEPAQTQLAKIESDLLALANNFYYATDYDKAIELYLKVLKISPKNEPAQTQLAKAERNRSLKAVPVQLPTQAIQLYKRARSFISAGDLAQAKELLTQAISIAKNANGGAGFPQAEELLNNLLNASKAAELEKGALKEIDTQQWAKALDNLDLAANLDPTDETTQTLRAHLQSLLKAQSLILQLNAELNSDHQKTLKAISEIQKIIDNTNEVTVLSKLWQEVVRSLGEHNSKGKNRENLKRYVAWGAITALSIIAVSFWFLYLLPRSHPIINDCVTVNGIEVSLNYPNYIANGDSEKLELTIKNAEGTSIDNGSVLVNFHGTANVYLETKSSKVILKNIALSEQLSSTIRFSLNEPIRLIADSSQYINFNIDTEVNGIYCPSQDFHIAITPIYRLRGLVILLWSAVSGILLGLFKDRITGFLFRKQQTEKSSVDTSSNPR